MKICSNRSSPLPCHSIEEIEAGKKKCWENVTQAAKKYFLYADNPSFDYSRGDVEKALSIFKERVLPHLGESRNGVAMKCSKSDYTYNSNRGLIDILAPKFIEKHLRNRSSVQGTPYVLGRLITESRFFLAEHRYGSRMYIYLSKGKVLYRYCSAGFKDLKK
ncbi:MAG: hypothetical protein CMO81_01845 [Waddliaceae bacterium]|nr:hypothetical protein [Waddliaceae bacterium]